MTTIDYIRKKVPRSELMAQLAEETAELAQAALKLRRVMDTVNPTPVSEKEALNGLYEEIAQEIRIASEIVQRWTAQLCLDVMTLVLNDPEIMGKDVFGPQRLKKL